MLHHVTLHVADLDRSANFYRAALKPLGSMEQRVHADTEGSALRLGFGSGAGTFFWLSRGQRSAGPVHIAFGAMSRGMVDRFHRAALSAGGHDNGAAGIRSQYHPAYYAAFVIDPDGNNIEAVYTEPTGRDDGT